METKRLLTEVTFGTEHKTANIAALWKYCGINMDACRIAVKNCPGTVKFTPYLGIKSTLSTDDIIEALAEYEITVKIINI